MANLGVVAFAFGTPATIYSNLLIAWIAGKHAIEGQAPILTQRDIQFVGGWKAHALDVTYVPETPGEPPPTLRIAREAVVWAATRRINKLVVVAAQPHLRRCMRDMEKAAQQVGWPLSVQSAPEIMEYPEDDWFRPESTQERTQTKKKWRGRERILEIMPFAVYKHVAK